MNVALPFGRTKTSTKAPKVKDVASPLRHPLRATAQVISAIVGAHLGKFIIVALYYLLFEIWHPMTSLWHTLIASDYWRHMVRDVGEGLLGGTLGQMLAWNAYKKSTRRRMESKPNVLDRFEIWAHIPNLKSGKRVTGWQLALAPLFVVLYAGPGFGVAALVMHNLNTLSEAVLPAHADYWQIIRDQLWASNWDKIVVGLFASMFMGRRPVGKFANDLQLWFAERRACSTTKKVRFYHTPAFKARVADVETRMEAGEDRRSTISHTGLIGSTMVGSTLVGVALAGFGYYVLTVIATRGH